MALVFIWMNLAGQALAAPDTSAPRVLHEVITKASIGAPADIRVRFQDQSQIFEPKLYYRRVGELEYIALDLVQAGKGEWQGTIPATFVTRDLEYFLEAFDILGNGPGRHGSPDRPHFLKVSTRVEPQKGPRELATEPTGVRQSPKPIVTSELAEAHAGVSVTKKWWFWTILGGSVAAVTVGVLVGLAVAKVGPFASGPATVPGTVTIRVAGPDPRDGL